MARVLPQLGLSHLDREFDYLVSAEQSDAAQPGVRVRIRFAGRLVDALVLERTQSSSHQGELRFIERVISSEVVAPEQLRQLVDALADRYAGTRTDLYRAAIPARHARAETTATAAHTTPWERLGKVSEPDLSGWSEYQHGESFVSAVLRNKLARAAWQVAPGDDWAALVAALAVKVAGGGGAALIIVPDQRHVDRCERALRALAAAKQVTVLTASQGPQARYSRYLSVIHGQARIVVGTRSTAFAPVQNLQLMVLMHDGDTSLVDPREPYYHAREVLTTRSSLEQVSLLIGGYTRTAETQMLVQSGWMHGLVAPRTRLRKQAPLIHAAGDSELELERDPRAAQARLPSVAFQAANHALERSRPVLFQVPRVGYITSLACDRCRATARCRWCNGPLGLSSSKDAAAPLCRWCGRVDARHTCPLCGAHALRAVVLGAERTAEELGRAFPRQRVLNSSGEKIIATVPAKPAIIVATPGAEPEVERGGYGAAVLLDTWALLQRADLRATEDAFYKWMNAAALVEPQEAGGEVVVVADPAIPAVQRLIRWDVPGFAATEMDQRRDARLPPAFPVALVDAPAAALEDFFAHVELPPDVELLGPVDLPAGRSLPGEWDVQRFGPAQRILVRAAAGQRTKLGKALRAGTASRGARKQELPLRVQVNPIDIG